MITIVFTIRNNNRKNVIRVTRHISISQTRMRRYFPQRVESRAHIYRLGWPCDLVLPPTLSTTIGAMWYLRNEKFYNVKIKKKVGEFTNGTNSDVRCCCCCRYCIVGDHDDVVDDGIASSQCGVPQYVVCGPLMRCTPLPPSKIIVVRVNRAVNLACYTCWFLCSVCCINVRVWGRILCFLFRLLFWITRAIKEAILWEIFTLFASCYIPSQFWFDKICLIL